MKPVVCHRLAASELILSAQFYEHRQGKLGERFLSAVDEVKTKIQRQPQPGNPGKLGTRSRKTRRFPFRIIYSFHEIYHYDQYTLDRLVDLEGRLRASDDSSGSNYRQFYDVRGTNAYALHLKSPGLWQKYLTNLEVTINH